MKAFKEKKLNRSLDYYRKMRAKHIRRKKNITKHYFSHEFHPYYRDDGRYSKGKIHCSCPMCRIKSTDNMAIADKRKLDEERFELDDL